MKEAKKVKKSIKTFGIIFLLFLILCILNGCKNDNNELSSNKEKVEKELDFLDTKIIDIMNSLNNISLASYTINSEEISMEKQNLQSSEGKNKSEESSSSDKENNSNKETTSQQNEESKNVTVTNINQESLLEINENDVNWEKIKNDIEVINESSSIIILDLSNLNIDSTDILNFSSTLNNSILSIKNENKVESLKNLAKLYSYIPKFSKSIGLENSKQNIKETKLYLMNAYSFVEEVNWTEIANNIYNCDNSFKNIMNDIEYIKNKEQKVNKTYVLIKELQNSIQYKDKKLFYIKYKNLIESINTL